MKILDICLSKTKDRDIIKWLTVMQRKGIEFSPYIVLAVEYYLLTDDFIKLGSITDKGELPKTVRKKIYIPDTSVVVDWATKQQDKKKGLLSFKLKYILNNCIGHSKKDEITDYAELLLKLEEEQKTAGTDGIRKPKKKITEADKEQTEVFEAQKQKEAENIRKYDDIGSDDDIEDDYDESEMSYDEKREKRANEIVNMLLPTPGDWM